MSLLNIVNNINNNNINNSIYMKTQNYIFNIKQCNSLLRLKTKVLKKNLSSLSSPNNYALQ